MSLTSLWRAATQHRLFWPVAALVALLVLNVTYPLVDADVKRFCAGKRAVLAAPVDGRLFFAGEATSPNFFSTAHGARDSGERAAGEVIRSK